MTKQEIIREQFAYLHEKLNTREKLQLDLLKYRGKIDYKNWRVVAYRCGLVGGGTNDLEKTGKKFGCTRERIRQIEEKVKEQFKSFEEGLPEQG